MKNKNFYQSLKCALRGFMQIFACEKNLKIDVFLGIIALILCLILRLNGIETAIIVFLISSIICLEILNSVLEALFDLLIPYKNERVKFIKDALAGMVLLMCITGIIIACIIFLPYIFAFIQSIF